MDINAASMLASLAAAPTQMPAAATGPADPLATARFEQVMNIQPVPLAPATAEANAAALAIPTGPRTMGDSILSGMQNLSTDFQQSWKSVSAALEAGDTMTTTDLLKLQLGLTQMSVQYDLVGKAISRSTQNLDQLGKLQ
jgi:type III secretion protein I